MKRNVLMMLTLFLILSSCEKKEMRKDSKTVFNPALLLTRSAQLEIMAKYDAFYDGTDLPDFSKLQQNAAMLTHYIYVQARTAGQYYFLLVPKAQFKEKGRYMVLDPATHCSGFNKLVIQSKYTIYY